MAIYDGSGNRITLSGVTGNPIYGKRICMLSDSNVDYYDAEYKEYMEDTYGCTFIPFGTASCKWATTEGANTLSDYSGVGKVNQILANVDENGLITEYDYIVIMLGTNDYDTSTPEETSANVSTACGAMRYCLEKLVLHGKNIPIGYVIPARTNDTAVDATMPERFSNFAEIARQYGIPTLNLFDEGRLIGDGGIPNGEKVYFADNLHFGEYGRKQFLNRLGKWIAYTL